MPLPPGETPRSTSALSKLGAGRDKWLIAGMIVTCREMKAIEERAFASGVQAEALMELAGELIARAVQQFFPAPGHCLAVYGKGHNGGDALVAARHLAEAGWAITLQSVYPEAKLAPLTQKKREAVAGIRAEDEGVPPTVVLDGILGIGARPGLHDPVASAALEINRLRREYGAAVFAIDIPTGLDGDSGIPAKGAVEADFTLAIAFAKQGLVDDAALDHVGRLCVLPLPELTLQAGPFEPAAGFDSVSTPPTFVGLKPPRRFGIHKGECGRVGVVAGASGTTGAAILAANAAVRAGAGLVSLFVTPDIYPVVAGAVMPEVMTHSVSRYRDVLKHRLDVIALGPGLGGNAMHKDRDDLLEVMESFTGPMVIDADGLNLLAEGGLQGNLQALFRRAGGRLLTPHPGEMARLFPEAANLTRQECAEHFLALFPGVAPLVLLLKGSRTLVAETTYEGGRLAYNSTGSPGMASGGMGDVLTGTCGALLAQGVPLFDAARMGAWVTGRAAENAVLLGWRSVESLCASDLLEFFGTAFAELRCNGATF